MSKVLYLSAAPRVTTHKFAENQAARSHILGVIKGLEENNYPVDKVIIGNKLPKIFSKRGSEEITRKNILSRFASDLFRIGLRGLNYWLVRNSLKKDYDFVYERFALMQNLGFYFSKRGMPWVLETNAVLSEESFSDSKTTMLKSFAYKLEEKAYQDCDFLVCVTESLKDLIISTFDVNPDKIYVMRNGVDTDLFKVKNKPNNHDELNVGYIGSITIWSNLELLVKTVKKLIEEGLKIKLHIIGDGPQKAKVMQLGEEHNISGNITFYGHVNQGKIPELSQNFDIAYCNTVHGEDADKSYASPMKLYEYMALKKPIIAGKIEDTELLIEESKTGYLFDWENQDELEDAIIKAYKNRFDLAKMGDRLRSKVVKEHSWKVRVSNLLAWLKTNQ